MVSSRWLTGRLRACAGRHTVSRFCVEPSVLRCARLSRHALRCDCSLSFDLNVRASSEYVGNVDLDPEEDVDDSEVVPSGLCSWREAVVCTLRLADEDAALEEMRNAED